ncbi:MAG TPA: 30S ribosomal protein S20 [Candidatus Limnocylindrales bacterium]
MPKTPRKWKGARSPSGLRQVRLSAARHRVLQPRRTAAKSLVAKTLRIATDRSNGADATTTLAEALSALDRAAKSGAIHPNAAARRKSRLVRHVNAALGGVREQTAAHVTKTTGRAQAAKAAKARIAAGKVEKAKGAQTAAGKARAALTRTTRAQGGAAESATSRTESARAGTSKTAARKPGTTPAKPAARAAAKPAAKPSRAGAAKKSSKR